MSRTYFTESLIDWIGKCTDDEAALTQIRKNARLLRLLAGLTQRRMNALLGLPSNYVASVENRVREYSDDVLRQIYALVLRQPMKSSEQLNALLSVIEAYIWPAVSDKIDPNSPRGWLRSLRDIRAKGNALSYVNEYIATVKYAATKKLLLEELRRICADMREAAGDEPEETP